ncbi:MAG: hypothetical protein Q4F96_01140 [Bacillota bacterium]|nr:hypothetical protein [Bacillota bacterium]
MTTKHNIPELLVSVGGRKQFWAAVNNGADAVCLGSLRFHARQSAPDFAAHGTDDVHREADRSSNLRRTGESGDHRKCPGGGNPEPETKAFR